MTSRNYKYFYSVIPGIITIIGNSRGGIMSWSNVVFSLVFLPFAELFFPEDKSNAVNDSASVPDVVLVSHFFIQIISLTVLFSSIYFHRIYGSALIGAALF